ncbi:hypothetical protein BG015_001871 [Linnemannia schmuckeri]|uniref:Uncharacterized protein n=1 Tax=Linnemannia schmuckeri TaxID=64567 RepID=A0A9P5RSM7_9FUNG|nr:hypothetical protein BG015_001871 [Linnemannia schmuckeri]
MRYTFPVLSAVITVALMADAVPATSDTSNKVDTLSLGSLRKSSLRRRATGTLRYVNVNEDDFTINDPASGECFLLVSGAVHVDNGTGSVGTVYSDRGCEDVLGGPLAPGSARDFGEPVPHSIKFA